MDLGVRRVDRDHRFFSVKFCIIFNEFSVTQIFKTFYSVYWIIAGTFPDRFFFNFLDRPPRVVLKILFLVATDKWIYKISSTDNIDAIYKGNSNILFDQLTENLSHDLDWSQAT